MKTIVLLFVIAFTAIECRKVLQINKAANTDFINMEMGGGPVGNTRPSASIAAGPVATPAKPVVPEPAKPVVPSPTPAPKPESVKPNPPTNPVSPKINLPAKPTPQVPNSTPSIHSQVDLKPVPSKPASPASSTPGPGNVQQLVTFYDSHGKASAIRPYSYSQAVKQG